MTYLVTKGCGRENGERLWGEVIFGSETCIVLSEASKLSLNSCVKRSRLYRQSRPPFFLSTPLCHTVYQMYKNLSI